MTLTDVAGAILWGGLAAAGFLGLLRRELARLEVNADRGRLLRTAIRVLSIAFVLAFIGVVNLELIPLAIVGFVLTRNAMLWRMGGCRGH